MAYHHHADIQHVQYAESQHVASQSKQQQKSNLRGHHNTQQNASSKNQETKNQETKNQETRNQETRSSDAKGKETRSPSAKSKDIQAQDQNSKGKGSGNIEANKTKDQKNQDNNTVAKTTHNINIRTFSKKLSSISATTSSQKCAASIRVALQSAGARIVKHPVAAADWGNTLKDLGYRQITPSFEKPQPGDIYIIDRTKNHIYGHIAGFTGKEWVSDFKQASHAVYKGNVSYRYFRLGS